MTIIISSVCLSIILSCLLTRVQLDLSRKHIENAVDEIKEHYKKETKEIYRSLRTSQEELWKKKIR